MVRRLAASWSRLALKNAPCARSSHGLSAIGGKAYLFGGEAIARTAIDSSVHCLDVEAGAWQTLAASDGSAPVPRVGHAQCAAQDKLYVFGGRTVRHLHSNWRHLPSRAHLPCFVSIRSLTRQSIEMAPTGFGSTAHLVHLDADFGSRPLNDLWQFEPATSQWTQIEPTRGAPPCPRSYHRAAALGDTLYVFGGCGESGRLADLHAFSLSERTWSALAPADLLGRGGAALETAGDCSLWMATGFAGHETRDVMRYDLRSASWQRVEDGWMRARSVAASMSLPHPSGAAVVIFGGEVWRRRRCNASTPCSSPYTDPAPCPALHCTQTNLGPR